MMILRLWTLLKVTTSVIFVADALEDGSKSPRSEPVDSWGQKINIVETLISQGLATPIKAVTNIEAVPVKVNLNYVCIYTLLILV